MQTETQTAEQQTVALQVREAALLPAEQWPDLRIRSIIKTVAPPKASVADIAMFLAVAQRYDLDPLIKEIWLAEDKGKLIVITGKDAILKKARQHPEYLGHVSGLVHDQDEFEFEQMPDDDVRVHHKIVGFPRGKLVGAYSIVRMKNLPPVWIVREIEDYAHLFSKKNWENYKPDMFLARVVNAAHRLAISLTGLYTREDFIGGELRPDEGEFADGSEPRPQGIADLQEKLDELRGRDVTNIRAQEVGNSAAADNSPDFETIEHDEPEPDRPGPVEAMAAAAREGTRKRERRGARTDKTKDELNREYFARLGEHTEWGTAERKLWQEQKIGKASCSTWDVDDYELALLLIARGELEYQPPLMNQEDPEIMPV